MAKMPLSHLAGYIPVAMAARHAGCVGLNARNTIGESLIRTPPGKLMAAGCGECDADARLHA